MDKSTILKAFNNHLEEFFEDLLSLFPKNYHLIKTKETLGMVRKANPKIIIQVWYTHIALKYSQQINNLDSEFVINKNYEEDIVELESDLIKKVLVGINQLREPIKKMSEEDKEKSMNYLKNLTQLCTLYSEQ